MVPAALSIQSAVYKKMKTITLSKGQEAMVDDRDYPILNCLRWNAVSNGRVWYASNSSLKKRMHNVLLPVCSPFLVDHIDGNGLNNQRSNLRMVTVTENNLNHKKSKRGKNGKCSSVYKGVSFNKKLNKWAAYITIKFKRVHLGCFNKEIEAAKRYDVFAKNNFGEYAKLNFDKGDV